jgi:hypothetical protein
MGFLLCLHWAHVQPVFQRVRDSHRLFPMAGVYLLILHLDKQCVLTSYYCIQIHSLGKNSSDWHDFWSLRAIGVLKGSFFNFPTDHWDKFVEHALHTVGGGKGLSSSPNFSGLQLQYKWVLCASYLRKLDARMGGLNRKIVVILDNYHAQPSKIRL